MKKAVSIIVVAFLCYNYFGYYLVSALEQMMIKEQIKEQILPRLPVDQLILIKVFKGVKSDLVWLEKDKEFLFKWTMYDVVKKKVVHDTTFYYCFNDKKETRILAGLNKLLRDQADHSKTKDIAKKLVINFFFQSSEEMAMDFSSPVVIIIPTPVVKSSFSKILSPPPERMAA